MKCSVFFVLSALLLFSCSDGKDRPLESRWRMQDTVEYEPEINEAEVFVSLDEFEKVLFAPLAYVEKRYPVRGFSQEISFEARSRGEGSPRLLTLSEKVNYGRGGENDFHLSYLNDHNEGWDIVWKEGFIYKKLLGGEYVRTYSMGEHTFYKEMLFRMIPDLYTIFRTRAEMSSSPLNGGHRVVIHFSDKKIARPPLPPKRYLQNAYGSEEMNNDRVIANLAGKQFSGVSGTLDAEVTADLLVQRLTMELSFTVTDEETSFTVRGERKVTDKPLLEVMVPSFVPEYHRRSFDAAKNIMDTGKNESHEEK